MYQFKSLGAHSSLLFWGLKFFFQWILLASVSNLKNILVGSLSALGNLR